MTPTHAKASASGVLKIVVGLLVLQALLVAAFVLPGHKPEPHDVPIGVVGSSAPVDAATAAHPGAFEVERFASSADAREAIEERDVYGALVTLPGEQQRLLIASAASAPIAQALQGAFAGARDVAVEDLAPLAEEDPRGATLNLMFLPLMVVCFPAVILLGSLGLRPSRLIGGLVTFAALGGLAVVALVAGLLDALPGDYLKLSAVAALVILAIALFTAGLVRLLGHAGIGLAALLFIFVGNPASGNGTAPELLPDAWRAISQLLPPGAGGTSLRNVAYFDGNAVLQPLLVLTAYALVGALLVLAADPIRMRFSRRRAERIDGPRATDDPILT